MNARSAFPNKLPHLMGTTNSYAKVNLKGRKVYRTKGRKENGENISTII